MRHMRGVDTAVDFLKPREDRVSRLSCPGIMVFSYRLQLRYMNPRALKMTGHLGQVETGPFTMSLIRQVIELRGRVQQTLASRIAATFWEPFELKRYLFEPGRKILLRGIGLPDRKATDHSRIVIVLEEVRPREAKARVQPPEGRRVAFSELPALVGAVGS